jgi:hypothetical protein
MAAMRPRAENTNAAPCPIHKRACRACTAEGMQADCEQHSDIIADSTAFRRANHRNLTDMAANGTDHPPRRAWERRSPRLRPAIPMAIKSRGTCPSPSAAAPVAASVPPLSSTTARPDGRHLDGHLPALASLPFGGLYTTQPPPGPVPAISATAPADQRARAQRGRFCTTRYHLAPGLWWYNRTPARRSGRSRRSLGHGCLTLDQEIGFEILPRQPIPHHRSGRPGSARRDHCKVRAARHRSLAPLQRAGSGEGSIALRGSSEVLPNAAGRGGAMSPSFRACERAFVIAPRGGCSRVR